MITHLDLLCKILYQPTVRLALMLQEDTLHMRTLLIISVICAPNTVVSQLPHFLAHGKHQT
jgi:hypothetical protein